MNLVKKISIFALTLATVVSMAGFQTLSVKAAGTYGAGSLLAKANTPAATVYYVGNDGKKHAFPDSKTYFTWYENFDAVVKVSVAELDMYDNGTAVSVRPGTKLVKTPDTAMISAVEPGGITRHIPTAAVAVSLYGANWASRVIDLIPGFYTQPAYTTGTALSTTLPTGTLVKDGSTYYYISGTTKRAFSSMDAFEANNFNLNYVVNASLSSYTAGTPITGAETALKGFMAVEGNNNQTNGNLTVSLAANTPVATALVDGQALADLAHFNFTASNAGAVTVRTLKVKRVGISADSDLTSIYLYDGANRLTDNVSVSNNYATFNDASGLFTVPAGTTKTIAVKANILDGASAGSTLALEIESAGDITSNSSSVGGAFPAMGNTHTIAAATLAGVALAGTTYPTASTVDAGEMEYTVWKNSVSITQRSVNLEYLRLRNVGSIAQNDLQNLKLFVDGVQYGTAQANLDSNGYVTFDLTSTPVTLTTGTRVIEVRADVVNGSSKTFQMSLRYAVDVVVKDTQYNAYVTASGTLPASATSATVNSGSLTVTKKTDSPSGNVQKDASGVTLASYELKAYGESIKVEHLRVTATSTNDTTIGQLRNGALFANGVQIGSTTDIKTLGVGEVITDTTAYTDYNLGSSLIVVPGTPITLEIKADVYDNDGTNGITSGDYLKATLATYTSGAQRMSSLGYINVPTNSVDGGTVSVVTGSLSAAKNTSYGNQNTIDDLSAYKLGSFIVSATEGENVNISQFTVGVTYTDTTGDGDTVATTLSDMYLVYGAVTTNPRGTVSASNNNFSVNYTMTNNTQMQVDVYANVNNTPEATDTILTTLAVSGTTAGSGTNADVTAVSGQTITMQNGSITAAVDPTTGATDMVIAAGSTTAAKFKLTTQYAPITLKDFTLKMVTASSSRSVLGAKLDLNNDGTADTPRVNFVYNAATNANYASFTGLNNPVAANTNKTIGVILDLNDVVDNGTSGDDVQVNLYSYKYSIAGVDTTATPSSLNGNSMFVRNTKPIVTQVSTGGTLTNGAEMDVYKFTVAANSHANVSLKQMKYAAVLTDVSTTANTLTLGSWRFFRGSTDITSSVSIENATGTAPVSLKSGGTAFAEGDTTAIIRFNTEEVIEAGASATYTIKATPSGFTTASDDDYFTIQMSGDAAAATAGNVYLQDSDVTSSELVAGLGAGTLNASVQAANFIWSDNAKTLHSATLADTTSGTSAVSTSSGDWTNGYLVKENLPSNSVQWVY